jgi:hypothetical protein
MKSRITMVALAMAVLIFLAWQAQTTWGEDPPPPKGQKPEIINQGYGGEAPAGGPDLAGAYAELRQLAQSYKEARSEEAKQRIRVRAEDLMSQVFDAKVQREQRRIEAEERRLNTEKELLHEKQMHKQDLVHQGVMRFFETGEPPEWATQGK